MRYHGIQKKNKNKKNDPRAAVKQADSTAVSEKYHAVVIQMTSDVLYGVIMSKYGIKT